MKKTINAKILGGQIPKGEVKISGAKNSATKLLAAALISDQQVILNNFPTELVDANEKFNFIRDVGYNIDIDRVNETVKINANPVKKIKFPDNYNYLFRYNFRGYSWH